MPVVIEGHQGPLEVNSSGYAVDLEKLRQRPRGVDEVAEGYTERGTGSSLEVTRVYTCPWSVLPIFRSWAMGHSNTEIIASASQLEFIDARNYYGTGAGFGYGPIGEVVDAAIAAVLPPVVAKLTRSIPAQDPTRPWLFASDWHLIQTHGVAVEDPYAVATYADGHTIEDADGKQIPTKAMAVADNSKAGNIFQDIDKDAEQPPLDDGSLNTSGLDKPTGDDETDDARRDSATKTFGDGMARVRITFRYRDYAVLSDTACETLGKGELGRYVRRTEEFALEGLALARIGATQLKFAEAPVTGTIVPEAGVVQLATATLTYEWIDVPDRPLMAYARCVGKTNAEPFDGLHGAPLYPAETLFCLPWRTRRTVSTRGRVTWQIQYRLAFRPQKWNRFPYMAGSAFLPRSLT